MSICNCTDPFSSSLFNSNTCKTVEQQKCMYTQYELLFSENFLSFKCVPLCPLECNRTHFRTSISSNEIITDLYYDYIKSNANLASDFVTRPITKETAKNSFVYVYFYYNSNSLRLSTDSPNMDIVSLLANIGGTLGLFIGINLIQICELVDVLIEIIFVKLRSI